MQFNISKGELKRALNGVKGAMETSAARMNLNGVNIRKVGKKIHFQATNGHIMARYTTGALDAVSGKGDFLVTADQIKSLLELCKGKGTETVAITADNVTGGKWSAILENGLDKREFDMPNVAKFPNVDQIVPASFEHTLDFSTAELKAALTVIAKMSDDKIKPAAFKFRDYGIILESEHAESGEASYKFAETGSRPARGHLGFNAAYALKALAGLKCDTVRLSFNGPLKPMQWAPADYDGRLWWIVMPLRIEWGDAEPAKAETVAPEPADTPHDKEPEAEKPAAWNIHDWKPVYPAPEPEPAHTWAPATLVISDYSEKAFLITGSSFKNHYTRIKFCVPKAHGVWHRGAGGWLFSKKHETAIRAALADILAA